MKRIQIITLGCKVNQYESAAFASGFRQAGAQLVKRHEAADLIVVNTCAVTGSAGAQSRQVIRQAIRRSPEAQLIVTGCYSELAVDELRQDPEIASRNVAFIGNSEKHHLVPAALKSPREFGGLNMGTVSQAREICRLPITTNFEQRSRAYLRIQDGCESFCSYCIVPYTRGPSRSLPVAEVIGQAKIFADAGHREIVLTGIHLGYYGKDLADGLHLAKLLRMLVTATPDTYYRISSLEPTEITDELLQLLAESPTIQPHLHIPLQSGHDTILAQMNRNYSTTQFREVVDKCCRQLPNCGIGIDILAGFPGETDELFEQELDFLKSLTFSYLHVFPYSIRPGTKAATMKGHVSKKIKDHRVARLRALSAEKTNVFYRRQLGRTMPVLVEGRRTEDGLLRGYTGNYVATCFAGDNSCMNSMVMVQMERIYNEYVLGSIPQKHPC
jgi:threonylcarbamoyladenosine tRNA methylthiotransferase MtaB